MIYIVQAISILFAVMLAKHDAVSVTQFEENGISDLQMAKFHRYNNLIKFFFCLVASVTFIPNWEDFFSVGVLAGLWIWLIFDPVLNKNRQGRNWDYIGVNDADGRRWIKWFGKNAGEMKAVILFVLIVAINALQIVLT